MDPTETRVPRESATSKRFRLGRRSYVGLGLTAAGAGSAGWLSRWIGTGAEPAEHTFRRQMSWRDTLPSADWDTSNYLLLYYDRFDTTPTTLDPWRRLAVAGPSHDLAVDHHELRFDNGGDGPAREGLLTPVTIEAPWVAVGATITGLSAGSRAGVGFARDTRHAVSGWIGPDGPRLGYRFDEGEETVRGIGPGPSGPVELLALLMGDRFALLTREPDGDWIYRGHVGWNGVRVGVDLFDRDEWARWSPGLMVETDGGGHVRVADFRVCHTLQFGVRDPTVVTVPDGTPFVDEGEIYLTVTCGSIDHRGYQAVLGLDIQSYDLRMHAALWAESVPGYVSNYVASHLMYDPDRDEFRQCWSGFGNGPREPYWNQKCWVSRTSENLLSGAHLIECELMHLPWGWTGRQHDPVVVWDEEAGAWRCVHTSEAIHRITVSETTDDTWTDGWTPVASYRDILHQIEGGKLAKVGGDIVLTYADQGSPNHMVTADYPDPAADRRWIDVDDPPGDVAPHPSLVAVPTEAGGKLLLVTMDGETVYGLGEPSHGGLVIYEATDGAIR